jgi:hypothetical protein
MSQLFSSIPTKFHHAVKLQEKKSAMVDATLSADESVSALRRRTVQDVRLTDFVGHG